MIGPFTGDHRWLSNFQWCRVWLDGEEYRTVEHAYVASKTLEPLLREVARKIEEPGKVKRFGRMLQVRPEHEGLRVEIMEGLVRQKFSPVNEILLRKLRETGSEEIVEVNTWGDTFWGVCNGIGENNLGRIIMKIRDEISV